MLPSFVSTAKCATKSFDRLLFVKCIRNLFPKIENTTCDYFRGLWGLWLHLTAGHTRMSCKFLRSRSICVYAIRGYFVRFVYFLDVSLQEVGFLRGCVDLAWVFSFFLDLLWSALFYCRLLFSLDTKRRCTRIFFV